MSGKRLLIIGLGLAYLGISFWVTTDNPPPLVSLAVALGPVLVPFGLSVWKTPWRMTFLLLMTLGSGFMVWKAAFLAHHIAWFYFVQYIGILTPLLLTFGRTLSTNHAEALCSRLACLLHTENLPSAMIRHTWQATWAWTLFFGGCLVISSVLFFTASVTNWSYFTDVITPLGLGTLFLLEWLLRRWRFPDAPRLSPLATVRAWQDYQKATAPR